MKRLMPFIVFFLFHLPINAQASLKSSFRVFLSKDTFLINSYSDRVLNIVADSVPIYKNAKIKVTFPKYFTNFAWDDMFWILIPPNAQAGYLQAKSPSSGKKGKITAVNICANEFPTTPSSYFDYKFGHENNQSIVTIKMLDTLPVGDTLQLIYGANGSATYAYNTMIANTDRFCVLLDNKNNGNYIALHDAPNTVLIPSTPKNLKVVLPSTTQKQKPSIIKLIVADIGNNTAINFSGTISLTCSDPSAVFPTTVTLTPADSGKKDVPVYFNQNGVFTVSAKVSNTTTPISGNFVSNPINVSEDSLNIYWGEVHTHGKISRDGFGDDGFDFARNSAGLDFYGANDHSDDNAIDTFGINKEEWALLKSQAIRYNKPGRFVTFLSYENSLDYPSGHYNFTYNSDDSLADNVPLLYNFAGYTSKIQDFWTKLNQLGQQGKVLTIPHHTGKLFGLVGADNGTSQFGGSFADTTYKRIMEIYSGHGQGEYYNPNHNLAYEKFGGRSTRFPCFAQDAWALKEKLGVIASTDSHNGTPSQTNAGYAAVITDSLTRNKIFSGLYNRHSYATTGERIVLKFKINNAIMGDELTVEQDSFPTINAEVNGTDNLDYIELLKWDFRNGTYTSNPTHPIYKVVKKITFSTSTKNYAFAFIDTSLVDTSLYYLRVKQKNIVSNREVWAWSSPIWVNKPTSLSGSSYLSDSLYDFKAKYVRANVHINWCMKDELNTDYFIIERHNTIDTNFSRIAKIPTAHIAFYDSCYSILDVFPDDSVLFYKITAVSYTGGIVCSSMDTVRLPYVIDSVYALKVNTLSDRIGIEWKAKEFFGEKYVLEKRKPVSAYAPLTTIYIDTLSINRSYSAEDFYPIKDTSYYRVWMDLTNGQHKLSNIDTLVFKSDSILYFKAHLVVDGAKNLITTNWRVAREQLTTRYTLQRSQDKQIYLSLQDLLPSGNTFDSTNYTYEDTAALPGWNYYRIEQQLTDGSIKYSAPDSIKIVFSRINPAQKANETSIKIVQHLIDADLSFVDYIATQKSPIAGTLILVGVDGRIYHQEKSNFFTGDNIGKIPIGGLSSGVYYLLLVMQDGKTVKDNFIITFHGGCMSH